MLPTILVSQRAKGFRGPNDGGAKVLRPTRLVSKSGPQATEVTDVFHLCLVTSLTSSKKHHDVALREGSNMV